MTPAEVRYYGSPGHCYDIDGGWWHDPGTCTWGHDCCGALTEETP
jgi:hypothetical protein